MNLIQSKYIIKIFTYNLKQSKYLFLNIFIFKLFFTIWQVISNSQSLKFD